MDNKLSQNQRKIYLAVVTIWLILLITLMSSIVLFDLQRARTLFLEKAGQQYQEVNNRVHIIESILEGFSAMISVTNDLDDRQHIRRYAQEMLEKYPYIFMFEIVEKVPHDKIDSFIEYYRKNIYPDFEVKGFSYESDRQWQSISERTYHLPIVFMEPFPEESRKVLGLDLGSNKFFAQALHESELRNQVVSSDPFKLVEGYLGYIIHRPIRDTYQQIQHQPGNYEVNTQFAVLVVRADTLLENTPHLLPGMRELLYKATFSETDPKGYLQRRGETEAGWLASRILPHLLARMQVDSMSQPFVLLVEQRLGWGIFSWGKLGLSLLAALFTFSIMLVYARLYFRHEMARANRYLQISRAMIIGLDRSGKVNLINPRGCEILGYDKKEILGRNWFETVVPAQSRDEVYRDFLRIVAGEIEPLSRYENDILVKSGETRHIDWNNGVDVNEKGEIVGTLSSGQDITGRKRAEAEAQRQQRELAHYMRLGTMGEMATGMAHELNQPLTALVSYCGTAKAMVDSSASPPKQIAEILSRAIEQAHRAADIIQHLRIFVSKKDENIEIFDLNKMIVDVISLLKWEIQESGAVIRLFPERRNCRIEACRIQIEQVLVNLLRNSLEALRDKKTEGRVNIKTRLSANDMIEVTVTDNGPGIDAPVADKLFQPFHTNKKSGMGIGLSLSRSIIEANGGTLWVDRNHTDGASFGFALPEIR
jgi:two-component system, LuxR family, sensor kinase FixL